jgi:tricorn protease
MIINENAGSGGDILPYMFRKAKAGPIIGKRSWGGTVGGGPSPSLLDGATMVIPHFPISDPTGTWGELEGNGVTPDIVVDQEPKLVAAGHDPQLEAAVKAVMDQLATRPQQDRKPPPSRENLKGGHGG